MVVRSDIARARETVEESKSQIEESKEAVKISKRKISEELARLKPRKRVSFTPRGERSAKMKYKRDLGKTSKGLTDAEKRILERESEIKKYEKDILKPAEKQTRDFSNWLNKAKKVYEKYGFIPTTIPKSLIGTAYGKEIEFMIERQDRGVTEFKRGVEEFQSKNPTEKLVIDWKKLKVEGVESGRLGESLSLDDYNRRIEEMRETTIGRPTREQLEALPPGQRPPSMNIPPSRSEIDVNLRKIQSQLDFDISGRSGSFTKAIDVGDGMMQDAVFRYENGKINSYEIIGSPMPQSERFIDSVRERGDIPISQEEVGYQYYDKPLKAFYDPLSGKIIKQSISPDIAKKRGLLPVSAIGFSPETGGDIIESETGLLTGGQLAVRDLTRGLGGADKDLPTIFEVGGTGGDFDPLGMFKPAESSYEFAARAAPYTGKEARIIDYKRLGPEGFYKKYGYDVTPEGKVIQPGTASPVLNIGPPRKEGEGFWEWYWRNIKSPESTESAFNIALLGTGAKSVYSLSRGGGARALRQIGGTGGALFSDQITETTSSIVDSIIAPSPTGFNLAGAPSQAGRGVLFYALASNAVIGPAYLTEIIKSAATNPYETASNIKDYVIENPYEVAVIGGLSKAELRLRQRVARSKMYYEVVDKLETQYGTKSPEVANFKKAWRRAFREMPKRADIVQKWTSKDLEVVAGDSKLIRILDEINSKYKPEIIGSTTIMPQTKLKELPRGKAGDIDVQNVPALLRSKSRKMAYEIYERLQREGYNVRIREGDFFGNKKYHITLNGKELINIGTNTGYFLKTQLGPLRDMFEFERIGQLITDPETGVRLSGIRGQLRVKLAKGYGADTSRIRQLKSLMKEGRLVGREKDIIDALGIVEGTDYLFEGKKYTGKVSRLTAAEILTGAGEAVSSSVRGKITEFDSILTGRKTGPREYGYYDNIPTRRRKPQYDIPKYEKPAYSPADYLMPKYPAPKYPKAKAPYKKPAYSPADYLMPKYHAPKYPKAKAPYKKPAYSPADYLMPQYKPPKKPAYKPPKKTDPMPLNTLIINPRPQKKRKRIDKRKKKKKKKEVLPTLTQQIIGYEGKRAIERPTGFEAIRII